jgi:hypothetical protein
MCNFRLSFSDDFSGMEVAPPGYSPVKLTLGSFSERMFSDQSVWSVADYRLHWRDTAKYCVENKQNVIFCSSLSKATADLWVAVYGGETVKFYSVMTKVSRLVVDQTMISPKASFSDFLGEPSTNWSCWEVPTAYLECFADLA